MALQFTQTSSTAISNCVELAIRLANNGTRINLKSVFNLSLEAQPQHLAFVLFDQTGGFASRLAESQGVDLSKAKSIFILCNFLSGSLNS